MRFFQYSDIINGEGTIYILKAKNKKSAFKKLQNKIYPIGFKMDRLIKLKLAEVINKNFFELLIKGILRENVYQKY